MVIGERIRQARLESGISQRALCEGIVTRNMLSLIENGRARPGMDTLEALALRLGKPMGYFLESQALTSPNQAIMENGRLALAMGDAAQTLKVLTEYQAPDPVFDQEKYFLEALCLMDRAETAQQEGRWVYARSLLEQAAQAGEKTVYYRPETERRRLLIALAEPGADHRALLAQLPKDSFNRELLARAEASLEAGDPRQCVALLSATTEADGRMLLLRGKAALEMGDPAQARPALEAAEAQGLREAWPLLEQCCRELDDFRSAYEYACKQRDGADG